MLRHRLAAFFEPRSLCVVADTELAVFTQVPAYLRSATDLLPLPDDPALAQQQLSQWTMTPGRDLAVICVRSGLLAAVLQQMAVAPPRALLLLPGQVVDQAPQDTRDLIQAWCQEHSVMLLGPRAFGIYRPHLNLNLSLAQMQPRAGRIAVISQSRMLLRSIIDWAEDVNLGLSAAVSLGEVTDVDLPELVEYLATDPRTDSIALYLDKLTSGRELISALRAASSVKPVIVLRAGRSDAELSGSDAVLDAALRRAGAIRVNYFVELFAAIKAMSYARRPRGGKIAMLANGRASAQLVQDAIPAESSMLMATLTQGTVKCLSEIFGVSTLVDNPVIPYVPLTPDALIEGLRCLIADSQVDAVMVILAPDEFCDMPKVVEALAAFAPGASKPIVTCLLGEAKMRPLRRLLDQTGMPAFRTPETALSAVLSLTSYHYNQQLLQQTRYVHSGQRPAELEQARAILEAAGREGGDQLSREQCIALLECFHPDVHWERDEEDEHFSTQDDVPSVMIRVSRDPIFGPWIWFGEGGHLVRFSASDRGVDLPPLNLNLAGKLIERSRVWRQELQSYVEPQILRKLQGLLETISEMVSELPAIESVELDPIVLGYRDLHIHEINIRLDVSTPVAIPQKTGFSHMAIYPYPTHLVQSRVFADGSPWVLRPIRPEDADALQDFIRGLSEKSRYMRFVSMMRELTPKMLTRYTYVDYHRELALVATTQIPNPANRGLPQEIIIGLAHYLRNADGVGAEYALVISDEWQKRGLGRSLMDALILAARQQQLSYLEGVVLSSNRPMLHLMTSLGFINEEDAEDPSMRRVWLPLNLEEQG
ncbi:bifunctional acetate--CoA ligase family protein/GNAT family N-acetyltransferase [Advenella mimigardefordensis]|uniref:Putative GNAT domain-containing CoA ligase n=1 Tax=Advenella mimigardefordensis (strain DSM 17166 / LMG 22922 / DPN7) TaxID=1247726 RepID=W0PDQ3_ADVMD|nr:GNAT family N-acetyltransferase [Advenella mimigardefordensis]AHG64999.1 putative GNAT domain-containing CoA ligase [Advenella mimigardefordensis DPN7]